MPEPLRTPTELLQQAHELAANPRATSADLGRSKVLIALAEAAASGVIDAAPGPIRFDHFPLRRYAGDGGRSVYQLAEHAYLDRITRAYDPAVLEFFSGKRLAGMHETRERTISAAGIRIEERSGLRSPNGRSVGAVSEMRDLSSLLPAEARIYSGLAEGTSTATGGGVVPIGYIAEIFAAMKLVDQILDGADWDTCASTTGAPLNVPSLTDISQSAAIVAEAGAVTLGPNPTFSQITTTSTAFGDCPTWSSGIIKASLQLAQDAAPALSNILRDAFAVRYARGLGSAAVSAIVADIPVGQTAAGASAITQADLLGLVSSLDPGYAASPTAAWSMSWPTLLTLLSTINTSATAGDALFRIRLDANGRYLLLGRPIYISNSMDSIAHSNKPVIYGDFKRVLVHHVPSQNVLRRYDEIYLSNYQIGFELVTRTDFLVMHAGGSSDSPLVALQMG